MKEQYASEAKERQKRKPQSVPQKVAEQKGDARDLAGDAVGVSGKTVEQAAKVLDKGLPELIKAVDADGPRAAGGSGDIASSLAGGPLPTRVASIAAALLGRPPRATGRRGRRIDG